MEVPQKTKNRTIISSSNSTPGYISEANENTNSKRYMHPYVKSTIIGERGQDGGRVRRGDHLPSHRYNRNISTRGTAPTEHPLNAGRRRQTSQKARKSPRTWVGQKKKRNNRDKRIGKGPAPVGGSCEGGKVSTH